MLKFSADSVSLRVSLKEASSFDSNDSLEATDPECSLESLRKVCESPSQGGVGNMQATGEKNLA